MRAEIFSGACREPKIYQAIRSYLEQMMQVIVEISFYPMTVDYDTHILAFVDRLRSYEGVQVTVGQTSTVLQGYYTDVFQILESECQTVLSRDMRSVLVMKMLNTR